MKRKERYAKNKRVFFCSLFFVCNLCIVFCSFPTSAFAQEEEQESSSAGGRMLSSLHSFGKGFTDASEDADVDYNADYALTRVKENPVLGLFPLGMLIAGFVMNFSPGMVIVSSVASFVVLVYFPTFTPAVGMFFIFAAIYHFILRPER
jgi:hypothetical protein